MPLACIGTVAHPATTTRLPMRWPFHPTLTPIPTRCAVQTMMSVDADRLVNLCLGFHELWSLPAQIGIALWLLYTQVC